MTDRQIVQMFEETHPKTLEEIQNLGLSPRFLAEGVSRKAYQLTQSLVVKLPLSGLHWEIEQSVNEIEFLENFHSCVSISNECKNKLAPT